MMQGIRPYLSLFAILIPIASSPAEASPVSFI
jgi:hypothetical protein